MPAGYEQLTVLRVRRVMAALQDIRLLPQRHLWLSRIPTVPAVEGEIMARWIERRQIADIVTDDAKAAVYQSGKFSLETTAIPNIKLGANFTQSQLNQIAMLSADGIPMMPDASGLGGDILRRKLEFLLQGIRDQMEYMVTAMMLDSYNWDRLGIKIQNLSWGMPSDLKFTPAIPWTSTSATPVTDFFTLNLTADQRYGRRFTRATMSRQAFQYMIATTEFQNKARTFLAPNVSFVNLTMTDLDYQHRLAQNVIGLSIEFNDTRYWTQDTSGLFTSNRYQPLNKVILTDPADDNDATTWDFANGHVTESMVSGLLPNQGTNMVGRFDGPARGPTGYCTVPPDLNPPMATVWGVARGFPRKYMLQASALMTVAPAMVDSIPVTDPFGT